MGKYSTFAGIAFFAVFNKALRDMFGQLKDCRK